MVTNLSHQSRRALPRDWVARKVAVHKNYNLVNMFLSSKIKERRRKQEKRKGEAKEKKKEEEEAGGESN